MRQRTKTLEAFAIKVEDTLRKGADHSTMERIVCRALTNKKHPATAAFMVSKWTEWRYGKPNQKLEVSGRIEHELRIEDVRSRVSELLDRRGRAGIIEIASSRAATDQPKQISDVLSGNGATAAGAIQKAS